MNWSNVKRNLTIFIAIFCGVLAIILNTFLDLDLTQKTTIILFMITALITSELVERRIASDQIGRISDSILGLQIKSQTKILDNREEVLDFLIRRTKASKHTILQASIDYARGSLKSGRREEYDKVRDRIIKSGKINYKYVATINDESGVTDKRRSEFIRKRFLANKSGTFYAGIFRKKDVEFPLMNFVVFDGNCVCARYSYEFGESGKYYIIEGEGAAELFIGYFNNLWNKSVKIENTEDLNRI